MSKLYVVHALHTTNRGKEATVITTTLDLARAKHALLNPEELVFRFTTGDRVILSACDVDKEYTKTNPPDACIRTFSKGGRWETEWLDLRLEAAADALA